MEYYKTYVFYNLDKDDININDYNINKINWYYDDNTFNESFYNAIYDAWINNFKYTIFCLSNHVKLLNNINLKTIEKDLEINDCIIYNSKPKNSIDELCISINDIVICNEKCLKFILNSFDNKSSLYHINIKYNYNKTINSLKDIFNIEIPDKIPQTNSENILKIGSFGFHDQMINKNDKYIFSEFVAEVFISNLKNNNINCQYVNPFKEQCDICFYSLFNYNYNVNINKAKKMDFCKYIMKDIVGYPIFIYYTPENEDNAWQVFHNKFNINKGNNYSISFYKDNKDNLYFPLWVQRLYNYEWIYKPKSEILLNQKSKFCAYIVSNPEKDTKRDQIFKYISKYYKKIDSFGNHLNNTLTNFILPKEDFKETNLTNINYFHPYKFILCCENSESNGNLAYITEKITNAFLYHTIPIYLGSENIEEYFNKNSFININNLSMEEIIDKIKEIDEDDEKYYKMLNEYPFIQKQNYKKIYNDKIFNFIIRILINHNYYINQYKIN